MKNLKIINRLFVLLISSLGLMTACDDGDDHLGDTSVKAANPTIAITVPTANATFAEKDTTFDFTVTMSGTQIVDVPVYVSVVSGSATLGEDFKLSSEKLIITRGNTSVKGSISFSPDDLPEGQETVKIQIGDERTTNATVTPQTMEFTVMNVSEGDLPLSLSWATSYFDVTGAPVEATDAADMVFYITDLGGAVVATADGAAFEELVVEGDVLPDGEYLIKAGVYSAIDPGGLGSAPVLDLFLDYSQVGKIAPTTLEFKKAFNTALVCPGNLYTLASFTKAGTNYTVTEVGEATSVDVEGFVGAYDADEPGYGVYTVNFALGSDPGVLVIDNFWDSGYAVKYVLDVCGTVTIPNQNIAPYTVTGAGTYNATTHEMVVDYVVKSAAGAVVDSNTHTFTKQ